MSSGKASCLDATRTWHLDPENAANLKVRTKRINAGLQSMEGMAGLKIAKSGPSPLLSEPGYEGSGTGLEAVISSLLGSTDFTGLGG